MSGKHKPLRTHDEQKQVELAEEAEFTRAVIAHRQTILDLVKQSGDALTEALKLSNEHGIPFNSPVSPFAQEYVPPTFKERFSNIDSEVVREMLEVYCDYDQVGWEQSQLC